MLDEIYEKYGRTFMKEYDTKFTEEKKQYLIDLLFEQKKLPDFEGRLGHKIEKISYLDGVKVYFENGGLGNCTI